MGRGGWWGRHKRGPAWGRKRKDTKTESLLGGRGKRRGRFLPSSMRKKFKSIKGRENFGAYTGEKRNTAKEYGT